MPNITKRLVDSLKPGPRAWICWDDELKGFGVQVLSSGTRSFVVQYRNAHQRQRRYTIGRYGAFTVDEARREARAVLQDAAKGGDPVEHRAASRAAPDVAALLDRYLSDHVAKQNAASTAASVEWLIGKHIRPRLGTTKVAAVTSGDVAKLHRAMASTPRQANLALSVLSKAFRLAEVWHMRAKGSNPVPGIKRYAEVERERFLSGEELARLGATLATAEGEGLPWSVKDEASRHLPKDIEQRRTVVSAGAVAAIRLLLFTGARLSEILSLRWVDVDFKAATIALPSRKGAGRKPHPANAAAMTILADLPRANGVEWVLPRTTDQTRHISKEVLESAWQKVRRHAGIEDVRLHDLRHTVGTFAGQAGGNAFIVRDLLRHRNVAMTSRYVNADADPIRAMADVVGDRIAAGLAGNASAEVVSINDGKRSR